MAAPTVHRDRGSRITAGAAIAARDAAHPGEPLTMRPVASALPDVLLEFTDGRGNSWEARSRASGSVHLDRPSGEYRVVL